MWRTGRLTFGNRSLLVHNIVDGAEDKGWVVRHGCGVWGEIGERRGMVKLGELGTCWALWVLG